MKLTRRDALLSMAAGGLGGYGVYAITGATDPGRHPEPEDTEFVDHEIATLVSVAEVVYPSAVEVTTGFVSQYLAGVAPARAARLQRTITEFDDYARATAGAPIRASPPDERTALLHRLGVDTVHPRPEGTLAERVRYHLVNTLLYALFTSPRGSRLVGIESPHGHPGGFGAYRTEPGE